ncbi:MAG: hypothetical protein JXR96_26810 [Deltaproteobacteria bacterium]|nr:hypothetical protein [Deltaproteobacteria bacterium]
MDRSKIAELIEQLKSAGTGWVGKAQREVAIRALRSESGQDFGPDVTAWRDWWASVQAVAGQKKDLPPLSRERATALAAMREMGVVDEDEFYRSIELDWEYRFEDLELDLRHYLRNRSGTSLWLTDELDAYCRGAYEIDRFVGSVSKLFGSDTRVEIEADADPARGFRLSLGGEQKHVTARPRQELFAQLSRYSESLRDGCTLRLDESNRAWNLTAENLAAIRRRGSLRFRKLHRASLGSPHPEVQAALEDLQQLGAVLELSQDKLAWEVCEYDAEREPARYSYHSQLVDLADGGIHVILDEFGDTDRCSSLAAKLSLLVEADLDAPACRQITGFVEALNAQLADRASPWHILAIRVGLFWCRFLPVPVDRVRKLSAVFECLAGHVDPPRRSSGMQRFAFGSAPTIDRVAPGAPFAVFDAECADEAADYRSVVDAIAGITGGEIRFDSVACEERAGHRLLELSRGSRTWQTELESGSDWVDLPLLLRCLNRAAEAMKSKRRFVQFRELGWGQEAGVAFVTAQEKKKLEKSGHLLVERED